MRHLVKWDPNGFSAIFRCTSSKYAHDFITKGAIKFNTPDSWVREAMKNGEGRGDLLEGSIAGCHMSDLSYLIELDKKYPLSNTIRFPVNDIIYFKRKKTMKIPCFCYYELKNSMFNCPNDTGIHTLKGIIEPAYFRDFADNKTPEQIDILSDDKKPSLIMITNFQEFRRRLTCSLIKMGLLEKEIIFIPINYDIDFSKGGFDLNQKPPYELSFKNSRFSRQSEARIIINTSNQAIIDKLTKEVIEVGSLDDIAEKHDTYLYEGVHVELRVEVKMKP